MQDIHLIGAGRMFDGDGGGGGTDRRLRQTHIQNQALKCPRCDSSNTKFCYYNNYNLSQPRHFCKSCRRYWTKGGVLRNVPVGGGCRKSSKRSSSSKASRVLEVSKPKSNNSNSSSESSSLTGTNIAAAVAAPAADLAAGPSASATTPPSADGVSSSFDVLFGFGHTKYVFPHIRSQNFSSELMNVAVDGGGCFNEIGNFSPMMTSSPNNDPTALNLTTSYDVVSSYRMNQHHQPQQEEQEQYDHRHQFEQWQLSSEETKLPDMADVASGYINPTAQIDQSSNLGSQPLSWQEQHQMFGLTSADDQVYWSQQQWSNADNSNPPHLYLP